MASDKAALEGRLKELETRMGAPDFWNDKVVANNVIAEYQEIKDELAGVGKYDSKDAVVTIFAGAGGDDAEDFSRMLFSMYLKFIESRNWNMTLLHEHQASHGGYRNITFEVNGKGAYGILKHEAGVHRLVRISPFNAKSQRHTSFSMVEVVPKFEKKDAADMEIPDADLRVEFSRSSGPGGQNVNKRDTAVRIIHEPSGITAHVATERSQEQNREQAMNILRAKLYRLLEDTAAEKLDALKISKSTDIEWGNQIRSYVLHPYQMVKDHRTNVEVRDVKDVLENGNLEPFLKPFVTS